MFNRQACSLASPPGQLSWASATTRCRRRNTSLSIEMVVIILLSSKVARNKRAEFRDPSVGAGSSPMRLVVASKPARDPWQYFGAPEDRSTSRSRVRIFRFQISGPESTQSVPLACGFASGTYPRTFGAANQIRSACNRFEGTMVSSIHCCHYRTFLKTADHSDRKGLWL